MYQISIKTDYTGQSNTLNTQLKNQLFRHNKSQLINLTADHRCNKVEYGPVFYLLYVQNTLWRFACSFSL